MSCVCVFFFSTRLDTHTEPGREGGADYDEEVGSQPGSGTNEGKREKGTEEETTPQGLNRVARPEPAVCNKIGFPRVEAIIT